MDGGQDFLGDWWDALHACLAPGASFHVFYDEAQDVYGARAASGSLESLPGFELKLSCRSPVAGARDRRDAAGRAPPARRDRGARR